MSGDYDKNYISGFSTAFQSSLSVSADTAFSYIYDDVERGSLTLLKRNVFKGICLSGFSGNNSGVDRRYSTDIEYVNLGDGLTRWKVLYTISEDLYDTDIGRAFTEMYGRSPLESGITESERQARIRKMPFAYTETDGDKSGVKYGAYVDINFRLGNWYITGVSGLFTPVSTTGNQPGQGGSKNSFNNGSPPVYKPGKIQPPDNWEKAYLPVPSPNAQAFSLFKKRKPPPIKDKFGNITGYGRAFHPGVDFAIKQGTAVVSILDGIVVRAGWNGGFGNSVTIYHPKENILSMYNHLLSISTTVGASLKQKALVGAVGSTGVSQGPHLHLEVWGPNGDNGHGAAKIDTTNIGAKDWKKQFLKQRGTGMNGMKGLKCNPKSPFCPFDPLGKQGQNTTLSNLIGWTLLGPDKKEYGHGRKVFGYLFSQGMTGTW